MLNKRKFGALLLAATMIMGMSTTALAANTVPSVGTGTADSPATVSITKDFEMAEGLSIPTVTFNFKAEKVTQDAPDATIQSISYGESDSKGNAADGKYTISKNAAISFGDFSHAGEYTYTITETKGNVAGITYSEEKYTLRVQVANKQKGGFFVKNITANKGTDGNKVDKILFTNTYRKNASLVIEKNTTGDSADKTKQFDFTITFTKSATEDSLGEFVGTVTRKGNTTEEVTCKDGTANFTLADGEKLTFANIPAGTKYKVTEKGEKDGYTASVKVTDNGTQGEVINGTDENDLVSSENGNYIGEKDNKVEFENKYNEVPITGIILNNLPFILMIGVAVLAFGTLAILKKRRKSER